MPLYCQDLLLGLDSKSRRHHRPKLVLRGQDEQASESTCDLLMMLESILQAAGSTVQLLPTITASLVAAVPVPLPRLFTSTARAEPFRPTYLSYAWPRSRDRKRVP